MIDRVVCEGKGRFCKDVWRWLGCVGVVAALPGACGWLRRRWRGRRFAVVGRPTIIASHLSRHLEPFVD